MQNINYKNTWTYHGRIDLPEFGGYLFNHGTESKKNTRTANHINDCRAECFDYVVLYENNDRLFGTEVIAPAHDSDYIKKLVEDINKHICRNTADKAVTWKDFKISLGQMKSKQRGVFDGLEKSKLSETECAFIPGCVSEVMLGAAINRVNKWYYNTKALRISAKAYKDRTKKEQDMAAKPIPREFHRAIIEALKHGKKFVELLNYKEARVQGLELSWVISLLSELRNLKKIKVIVTADDKEKHQEVYNIMKESSRFELMDCDTDTEVEMEYKNMKYKPDLDIMNPPYDGSLHLVILENVLANKKPNSTVISIQPVRWLEDPLAEYKQGSDAKKYRDSITDKISNLQIIDATTACKVFKIMNATDLGIYTFNQDKSELDINKQYKLTDKLISKITTMIKLADMLEQNKVNGYRCEIKELTSGTGGHNLGNFDSSKIADVNIVWGPYQDGYDLNGIFFNKSRQKNQFTKDYFANSIIFNTMTEASNFEKSCNSKFYRRLVHLLKWDVHVPLRFLPYMEDYSHVWTDQDYCKFFGLNEEESEFMCREVDDYRIKDFINYINLEG